MRRIYCVGRNYEDHARELGNNPKDPPFFFSKPATALLETGRIIPYPKATDNLHFEGELVVAIGPDKQNPVFGYAAGNDLTRRDLQAEAKTTKRPWDMAKGFDQSAVCGAIISATSIADLGACSIETTVNGARTQFAALRDMIWDVDGIIHHLKTYVDLMAGDLIFTGTPAGIGRLNPGDTCCVTISDIGEACVTIAP
ncbi:MAG: fumarylacetoacetate hydrolase family protein [Halocynthiibacter sp.]